MFFVKIELSRITIPVCSNIGFYRSTFSNCRITERFTTRRKPSIDKSTLSEYNIVCKFGALGYSVNFLHKERYKTVKKSALKGNLILMLTAVIWGVSFVSQRVGMEYIKPNTFNGIRTMIGVLILIPFIFVRDKADKSRPSDIFTWNKPRSTVKYK